MTSSEITIINEFVQKAKLAKDYVEAEKPADAAIAAMKAAEIGESSAIAMLSSAATDAGDDPGLFYAFTALEKRKP
jgi:hypothetical protein